MKKHNKHKRPDYKSFRCVSKDVHHIGSMRGTGLNLIDDLRKELIEKKENKPTR